jgi:hypothetical protein
LLTFTIVLGRGAVEAFWSGQEAFADVRAGRLAWLREHGRSSVHLDPFFSRKALFSITISADHFLVRSPFIYSSPELYSKNHAD